MEISNQKRPKPHIPRTPLEKTLEVLGVLGVLFIVGSLAFSWSSVPDTIPTHFNAAGQANAYGSKDTLFTLPAITVVLYVLLTVVGFFPYIFNFPWRITEQNAEAQYRLAHTMLAWLKVELVALLGFIHWSLLQAALGQSEGLSIWFLPVGLVVVFGTIGVYIRLLYRAR